MSEPTTAELLTLVRTAIAELLQTGQSVAYQGRSLTMANLGELRAAERDYAARLRRETAAAAGKANKVRPIYVEY